MGYRLSKIYTRTGDSGTTGLGDGSRIAKHSLRMDTIGTVDELNSVLGVLIAVLGEDEFAPLLRSIQNDLFDLGGELSIPGHVMIQPGQVTRLEEALDAINEHLPPLTNFILPGGSLAASHCHLARTVCRRAERLLSGLMLEADNTNPAALGYLNRLSDLLFVCARALARRAGGEEVLWQPGKGGK